MMKGVKNYRVSILHYDHVRFAIFLSDFFVTNPSSYPDKTKNLFLELE